MPTVEQYQVWLNEALNAKHELATGKKVVSASYYGRSVNYTPTSLVALDTYIQELQSKISGRARARRPFF